MSVALAATIASIVGACTPVAGWFVFRAFRNAQVNKLNAETRRTNAESAKTEAESWQMLNGGLSARVSALEAENADLRTRLNAAELRAEEAEELARKCRIDLDDLRRRMGTTDV